MTGIVTGARLSFRLQRLEILLLGAAVLLAPGLMLWWAFQLDGIAAWHGNPALAQLCRIHLGEAAE